MQRRRISQPEQGATRHGSLHMFDIDGWRNFFFLLLLYSLSLACVIDRRSSQTTPHIVHIVILNDSCQLDEIVKMRILPVPWEVWLDPRPRPSSLHIFV